jgi:hypothetical protein
MNLPVYFVKRIGVRAMNRKVAEARIARRLVRHRLKSCEKRGNRPFFAIFRFTSLTSFRIIVTTRD